MFVPLNSVIRWNVVFVNEATSYFLQIVAVARVDQTLIVGIGVQHDGVSSIHTIVSSGFTGKAVSGELITSEESLEVGWFYTGKVLDVIGEDFTRDKVRCVLNYDGRVTYGVFFHNPYVLHGVRYL